MKHVVQNNQSSQYDNNDVADSRDYKVYVNKIVYQGFVIITVCDEELLGKEIETPNGKITINEPFYGGSKMSLNEALRLIRDANNVNLLGRRIVEAAIREGLISEDAVINLSGIPHAIILSY